MVDNNPDTLKQLDMFLALPEFGRMVQGVSQRLGFRYNLTQGDLEKIIPADKVLAKAVIHCRHNFIRLRHLPV